MGIQVDPRISFRQMHDMRLGFDVWWSAYSRSVLQWSRCVLKSPWLCRLGDASYVMCTAMMVLYDRARVGPTMKTSDEISIICLFRLIPQANILFCLGCGIRVASKSNVDSIPSLNGVLIFLCEY